MKAQDMTQHERLMNTYFRLARLTQSASYLAKARELAMMDDPDALSYIIGDNDELRNYINVVDDLEATIAY